MTIDKQAIEVLIADDHPVVRAGLKLALALDAGLSVIAEVADGQSAIETAARLNPDVVVLDISMPLVDGIAATKQIRSQNADIGIVVLTAHEGEDLFRAAMDAGANAYLLKDNALLEIAAAIRAIRGGGCYVTRSMANYLKPAHVAVAGRAIERDPLDGLAPIERRIVARIAEHRTTRAIADELGLSVRTIENRRAAICSKLGLRGSNALLMFALTHKARR